MTTAPNLKFTEKHYPKRPVRISMATSPDAAAGPELTYLSDSYA